MNLQQQQIDLGTVLFKEPSSKKPFDDFELLCSQVYYDDHCLL
jgi:hypothetical protein